MKPYSEFTIKEWLNVLESRHQQEIQLGLERIKQVACTLELLKPNAKIITVAGTNGKGSTVATLEAIYQAAGYQVASYTSPHLFMFNERIKLNKQPISDQALCRAFTVIENERNGVLLTYFEMATLAALWHFKQYNLDVIILEVGLGGRMDATNIIDADLAIITTIDFDHQAYLGDTTEAIGFEKAGIMRPYKLFIYADKNPPQTVISQSIRLKTRAYFCGRDYDYHLGNKTIELSFLGETFSLPKQRLHPNSVIAAVISSILLKENLPLTGLDWDKALCGIFLPGRLQLVQGRVNTLFDVAHNPQSVTYLSEFIEKYNPKKQIYAVFSGLRDKDIPALVNPLIDYVDHWYPTLLSSKRAATREQIQSALERNFNKPITIYENPLAAYKAAISQAKEDDLIVVYGSFITVAEVMSAH